MSSRGALAGTAEAQGASASPSLATLPSRTTERASNVAPISNAASSNARSPNGNARIPSANASREALDASSQRGTRPSGSVTRAVNSGSGGRASSATRTAGHAQSSSTSSSAQQVTDKVRQVHANDTTAMNVVDQFPITAVEQIVRILL